MSQSQYKVVIGGSASGKPDEAAEKLATLLNIPKSKATEIMQKVPTALDKIMPLSTAQQYQSRLKEAGILSTLEPTEAANDAEVEKKAEDKPALDTGMFANLSLEDGPEEKKQEKTESPPQTAADKIPTLESEPTPQSINEQFAEISEEIGNSINVIEDNEGKKPKGPAPVAPGNMRCPQCKTEQKKAAKCTNCNADIATLVSGKTKRPAAPAEEEIMPPAAGALPEQVVVPKPTRRKPAPKPKPRVTGFTFLLILILGGVLGGTYYLKNLDSPEYYRSDSAIEDLNKTRNKLVVLRDSFKKMVTTTINIDAGLEIPKSREEVIEFLNLVDRDIFDAWGKPFIFKIDGAEYSFTSSGRDKKYKTPDDIVLQGILSLPATTPDEPVDQAVTDGAGDSAATDPATGTTQTPGQVTP